MGVCVFKHDSSEWLLRTFHASNNHVGVEKGCMSALSSIKGLAVPTY